jgi:hypothetical protein
MKGVNVLCMLCHVCICLHVCIWCISPYWVHIWQSPTSMFVRVECYRSFGIATLVEIFLPKVHAWQMQITKYCIVSALVSFAFIKLIQTMNVQITKYCADLWFSSHSWCHIRLVACRMLFNTLQRQHTFTMQRKRSLNQTMEQTIITSYHGTGCIRTILSIPMMIFLHNITQNITRLSEQQYTLLMLPRNPLVYRNILHSIPIMPWWQRVFST